MELMVLCLTKRGTKMKLVRGYGSLFPSLRNGFFDDDWFGDPSLVQSGINTPAVNIKDTLDHLEVEIAAPGMKKDDFQVDLENDMLTISAEVRSESSDADKEGKYSRREFSYSSFSRSFALPNSVVADKIAAKYKDGVLRITLPKKEEAIPKPVKQIAIS
jgi:HSP20 family protein